MSEVALPSAGKGEFPRLQEALAELQAHLDTASANLAATPEADAVALSAHDQAAALLANILPRAEIFEKRAKEPDPDKRIYGPKMVQKIKDFCASLAGAVEHEEEVRDVLAGARARQAAATDAAAAAAAAAEAAAAAASADAAAAAEAQAAAAEAAAQQAAVEESQRRAEAIAAPLFGTARTLEEYEAEADAMGRRPLTLGLDFNGAMELLVGSCSDRHSDLAEALQALQALCTNIIARPEDPTFRTVRLLNDAFQRSVARHRGGVEALLGLGFEQRDTLEGEYEAVFLVLDEPSLEDDYEGWAAWYDGLKARNARLLELMAERGVRPVPAASKGVGWSEPSVKPPEMEIATATRELGGTGG